MMTRRIKIALLVLAVAGCGTASPKETVAPPAAAEPPAPPEMAEGPNLLENATFDSGVSNPWMPVVLEPAAAEASVARGAFCADITALGANPWDIQMSHRGLRIQKGHSYGVRARIWSTAEVNARAKVGMSKDPYPEYWSKQLLIGPEPKWLTGEFVMNMADDATAEFAVFFGGNLGRQEVLPYSVCIDDVVLSDPDFDKPVKAPEVTVSKLAVNQVGYLPGFTKTAVLQSESTTPVKWQLVRDNRVVGTGNTKVLGDDAASGHHLHLIDFTNVNDPGTGYVLMAGADKSHPFEIGAGIYDKMKYDALAYFYHNRSGIPIEMPYAGGEQWTRPAGHLSDEKVACLPGSGCRYTLDVKGGWYDAGDHGKYVVNAGYSVWAMLNEYERAVHLGKSDAAFKDGTLNIPENKNGVPDLLDEARFEIEFMLKMEVPEGEELAGMVHHKFHDEDWTGIPTAPHEDPKTRYLNPPNTAATLNLAAVAAQAARIWKNIDAAFAETCLEAAKRTYEAALEHPEIYAKNTHKGGGPYEDNYVKDEFFWAAAELYITSGEKKYLKALKKSPHYGTLLTVDQVDGRGPDLAPMSWQATDALGTLSLAVVPSELPKKERAKLTAKIAQAADHAAKVISEEGYRMPLASKPKLDYYWGSNFVVMNNLIILALASDLTGEAKYPNALAEGMDYLLGKNPMDQCYVTGYGTRPLKNPHHRFWAHQADPSYPPAPPGGISGGPNQHMQDPRIKAAVPSGSPPATVFVDHIDSYSTNEVAINWNAAFAWLAAYLDEMADKTASE